MNEWTGMIEMSISGSLDDHLSGQIIVSDDHLIIIPSFLMKSLLSINHCK